MTYINQSFDEERALYNSRNVILKNCRFEGPADGESALKESSDIKADGCFFALRYPFWHDKNLLVNDCEMTAECRAALWYSENIIINNTKLHGVKALRECNDIIISGCDIESTEFGWFNTKITMKNTSIASEYFMLRSSGLKFDDVTLNGKYSFQYIVDSELNKCQLNTKDAFWHAKNVVIKDSVINGEYLAWYSENVTFENCTISGTQPFCYCKNLTLKNCVMKSADLAFEKSEVDADIVSDIVSIKNPKSGRIKVKEAGDIIKDDPESKCEIIISK